MLQLTMESYLRLPLLAAAGIGVGLLAGAGMFRDGLTAHEFPSVEDRRVLPPETAADEELPAEEIDSILRSLGPVPTISAILESDGFEQSLLVARFVADASVEELATLFDTLNVEGRRISIAQNTILLRWTLLDPIGALDHVFDDENNFGAAMVAWAKNDPAAALEYIEINDPDARFLYLVKTDSRSLEERVLDSVSAHDPARSRIYLADHPELGSWNSHANVTSGLARTDPYAAAEYGLNHGISSRRAIESLSKLDPGKALSLALEEKHYGSRLQAAKSIVAVVAENEGAEASITLARTIPSGRTRVEAIGIAIEFQAGVDPSAALETARNLRYPNERFHALQVIANAVAESDPTLALAILAEGMEERLPGERTIKAAYESSSGTVNFETAAPGETDYIYKLAMRLSATHPQETLNLLDSTHATEETRSIASRAAMTWVDRQPEEASLWISNLPGGAFRETIVTSFVHSLLGSDSQDFEAALAWTLTLEEGNQGKQLETVFRKWNEIDPEGAAAATESVARKFGTP